MTCMHGAALPPTSPCCLGAALPAAGVVGEDGTQRIPGLSLNSKVAVPALNIPASDVSLLLSGTDGAVQPNVKMQVCISGG